MSHFQIHFTTELFPAHADIQASLSRVSTRSLHTGRSVFAPAAEGSGREAVPPRPPRPPRPRRRRRHCCYRRMVFYTAILSPGVLSVRKHAVVDSTSDLASSETQESAAEVLRLQTLDSRSSTGTGVSASEDVDRDLPQKLPAVVVEKFLELHRYVAAKEKHRRLREALLKSAAQLELSSQESNGDSARKKIAAEIKRSTHPDEAVGVFTRQFVRGRSSDAGTSKDPGLAIPEQVDVFDDHDKDLNGGNNASVLGLISRESSLATMEDLDSFERAGIVHKLTGEAQVRTHTRQRQRA